MLPISISFISCCDFYRVSFGTYSSVFSFCVTLCVCFYVLGKLYIYCSWKKWPYEEEVLLCLALCIEMSPIHQNLVLQGCLLCLLCVPCYCGWAIFSFSPFISSGSLYLLWIDFVPCIVSGLGLSWVRPGVCQSCGSTKLQSTFPVFSLEKLSLVSRAYSQTRRLPPDYSCGWSWISVYRHPSLSLGQEPL